ncbi:MAG: AAA family ATPase [Desulfobacteraceae bacterium]|nr:AAA family ATPase [Desulfobacteraceae bacterium]
MRIQQLRLENVGCFADKTFDFSNLSVIFGENRTGKSTVVYALFFALFGAHLHKGLRLEDLCRKGEKTGVSGLFFNKDYTEYKLRRSTSGMPGLYTNSEGGDWQPVISDNPNDFSKYIPISKEVASLTSFFREGELIYFLEDIPKYNKTLLEKLIGIDNALIVRSRFKKTFERAREAKSIIQKSVPEKYTNYHALPPLKKEVAELEQKYQHAEEEHKKLSSADPNTFALLQKQYEEKKKALDSVLETKEKMPHVHELEKQKKEFENQLTAKDDISKHKDELQRKIGGYEQEAKSLQSRIEKFERLEKEPVCPNCEQSVASQHLSAHVAGLKKELLETIQKQSQTKEESGKADQKLKDIKGAEKALTELNQKLGELSRLEKQITQLKEQVLEAEENYNKFRQEHPDIEEIRKHFPRKKELETERNRIQNQIIDVKAKIKQQEYDLKHYEKIRKDLQAAERRELLCNVAFRAADNAIQELSRGLLNEVRKSVRVWTENFNFLHQFDIEITDKELLPIIQAKGYQYKLNQMSKSERIFLYLMLKLAIGDALGHLGIFILDDPADGLDIKRKQTLAYLLAEISKKRQIIITTNDSSFSEMFPGAALINL